MSEAIRTNNANNELIEIKGNKYRIDKEFYIAEDESHIIYRDDRYNQSNGYYKCLRNLKKNMPANLHRAVWLNHFGSIPEKHHIHHLDGNRGNNHVENLQCLPAHLHLSRACKTNKWLKSTENLEQLKAAREKGAEWQKSKEGRECHRRTANKTWKEKKPSMVKCHYCSKDFEAWFPSRAKYCHRNCRENDRKKSGVENENRQCVICQKYFIINKYCHTKTCSKACGIELYRISRKENKEKKVKSKDV